MRRCCYPVQADLRFAPRVWQRTWSSGEHGAWALAAKVAELVHNGPVDRHGQFEECYQLLGELLPHSCPLVIFVIKTLHMLTIFASDLFFSSHS